MILFLEQMGKRLSALFYAAGWQYASGTVGVKDPGSKTVDYVYLRCCYYQNANGANFDRIKVNIDECGTSYTYDNDGNLISAKDNAGRHESYNYNNASDMTKLTTADNKAYSFTYDNTYKHRMRSATSESSGVNNSFTYDASGNLTKTRVDKSGYAKYIEQGSTYTSNGNYLATSTAANGYSTTYNYNAYKGTLNSVTDANGKETKYTYDANTDRMTSVEAVDKASAADNSKVEYTYAKNGQLTSIKSPGDSPTYNFVYDKWGNNTEVKVGSQTLVTNTYKSNNGLLTQQEYGNGFKVGHNYDSLDRETSRSYNGTTKFYWTYNADGNLARYSENGNRVLTYLYDDIGRLLQVSGNDGSYVKTSYDELDKSTDLHYKFNGQRRDVYFHYSDKDNLPLDVKFGTGTAYAVTNLYDGLTRVYEKDYTLVGNTSNSKLKAEYSYVDWSGDKSDRTTGTVRGIDYTYVAEGLSTHDRWYTYDNVGNILTECRWISSSSKPVQESYTYDAKNQLVRHDSATLKAIYTYEYDLGGNIKSKTIYNKDSGATSTINYIYGNSAWGDELTSYGNESIEYDKIGNPTLYRGWGMTWQGRQLATAEKGGTTLSYTYDSEGIRTSKSDGTNTTKYLLNGTQILAQTTNGKTLCFFYDQQGNRVGMADGKNNFYYYIYNVQGDVIALADASTGKLVVTYTYDAWGKLMELKDTTANSVGTQNPFRYRGYYYDAETGLYYLQSRYYDPEVGRFINADGQLNEGVLGYNMFAYCENNPVMRDDPTGHFWGVLLGVALVVGIVASLSGCSSKSTSKPPSDYIDCKNERQNCYQYALSYAGMNTPDCFVDPGYRQSYGGGNGNISSVNDLKKGVETDLRSANLKYSTYYNYDQVGNVPEGCTLIAGYTIPSSNWFYGDYTDYHFAVRLSDGSWADKPGSNPSRYNQVLFDGNSWIGTDKNSCGKACNTVFFVIYS